MGKGKEEQIDKDGQKKMKTNKCVLDQRVNGAGELCGSWFRGRKGPGPANEGCEVQILLKKRCKQS